MSTFRSSKEVHRGPEITPSGPDPLEAVLLELEEWDLEEIVPFDGPLGNTLDEAILQEVAEQTNYGAVFLNDLIKRQLALSISVAVTFLFVIFSFPLFNYFLRPVLAFEIFGIEISWFFLALLFYPFIWALAFYFASTADKYEDEFTRLIH